MNSTKWIKRIYTSLFDFPVDICSTKPSEWWLSPKLGIDLVGLHLGLKTYSVYGANAKEHEHGSWHHDQALHCEGSSFHCTNLQNQIWRLKTRNITHITQPNLLLFSQAPRLPSLTHFTCFIVERSLSTKPGAFPTSVFPEKVWSTSISPWRTMNRAGYLPCKAPTMSGKISSHKSCTQASKQNSGIWNLGMTENEPVLHFLIKPSCGRSTKLLALPWSCSN